MQFNRTSTYLISFAGILLIINFLMIFFIFRTVRFLENDAGIINNIGIIRGSIQRITKLELSGETDLCKDLIEKTDLIIKTFLLNKKKQFAKEYDHIINSYIKDIENNWQNLKKHMADYRENRSENIFKQIINDSENCWKTADAAVLEAQLASENKISRIKLIYIILFAHILNTLILIWIAYSFVRKNLEYRASHDSLTGLLNRHSYEKHIETELERSKRYNHKLSLILFDIDRFKTINDTYGHKTGDIILFNLSQAVRKSLRKNDAVFRVGGEEFAIIIPEAGINESLKTAEKIREKVENYFSSTDIKITISMGVAESAPDKTQSDLYRQADEALYKAKNTGRNKVEKYINNI